MLDGFLNHSLPAFLRWDISLTLAFTDLLRPAGQRAQGREYSCTLPYLSYLHRCWGPELMSSCFGQVLCQLSHLFSPLKGVQKKQGKVLGDSVKGTITYLHGCTRNARNPAHPRTPMFFLWLSLQSGDTSR